MDQAPVSCLPTTANRMSKARRVLEEAKEAHIPELDLSDKGVSTFEEMPGLSKFFPYLITQSNSLPNLVSCLWQVGVYTVHSAGNLNFFSVYSAHEPHNSPNIKPQQD